MGHEIDGAQTSAIISGITFRYGQNGSNANGSLGLMAAVNNQEMVNPVAAGATIGGTAPSVARPS